MAIISGVGWKAGGAGLGCCAVCAVSGMEEMRSAISAGLRMTSLRRRNWERGKIIDLAFERQVLDGEVRAIPNLRIETWGTDFHDELN
jgi:hypothetical protein